MRKLGARHRGCRGHASYLPLATNAAFHENRAIVGRVRGVFTIG
jgi:hypothetical protein